MAKVETQEEFLLRTRLYKSERENLDARLSQLECGEESRDFNHAEESPLFLYRHLSYTGSEYIFLPHLCSCFPACS